MSNFGRGSLEGYPKRKEVTQRLYEATEENVEATSPRFCPNCQDKLHLYGSVIPCPRNDSVQRFSHTWSFACGDCGWRGLIEVQVGEG